MNMGTISAKTRELLSQIGGPRGLQQFANIWNGLAAQRRELEAYKQEQAEVLQGMDELSKQRRQLAQRFDLVGEGELEEVLQIEQQIEAKHAERRRAAAEERRARLDAAQEEAALQAEADAKRISKGSGGSAGGDVLRIEWSAPSRSVAASASAADREQAERIAGLVVPMVMDKLARSKSVSVRAGGSR